MLSRKDLTLLTACMWQVICMYRQQGLLHVQLEVAPVMRSASIHMHTKTQVLQKPQTEATNAPQLPETARVPNPEQEQQPQNQ